MSPEQVKDPRGADPRSDLWSAAVMTWEMLTGRVAFPAPTEYARLAAVTSFTPDTLEKVDGALAPISPVIGRAMQKDPGARFTGALDMARALPANRTSTPPPPMDAPTTITNTSPTPLSRLPAVPSVFGPSSGISPGASSEQTRAAAEVPVHQQRPGGGTLQSATAVQIPPTPAPPRVVVLSSPAGSTMPSHDLPVLERPGGGVGRTVPAWLAVVLVLSALAAGFVMGFAVARAM
jgi:serine/threonine-protein kinase